MNVAHHDRPPPRILVADGDDSSRARYRDSLHLAGCDVVDAADGREALTKALSQRPSLVIMETRLDIFDGYALCDVLRRDFVTRMVPILVVTAETRASELERARTAGADLVLVKPVEPATLLHHIRRLLEEPATRSVPTTIVATAAETSRRAPKAVRAHSRFQTRTPPAHPPSLFCPLCDRELTYLMSHVGGVSRQNTEQWDAYQCRTCGAFEYRQRTRKLRHVG